MTKDKYNTLYNRYIQARDAFHKERDYLLAKKSLLKTVKTAQYLLKEGQERMNKIKVFLDDEKEASFRQQLAQGYDIWVTTPEEVIDLLKTGKVSHVSLDHDLALEPEDRNGYMVAKWIEEQAYHGTLSPLKWNVHSQNPTGRSRMIQALQNADKYWNKEKIND
jgi:hypothetical protein